MPAKLMDYVDTASICIQHIRSRKPIMQFNQFIWPSSIVCSFAIYCVRERASTSVPPVLRSDPQRNKLLSYSRGKMTGFIC